MNNQIHPRGLPYPESLALKIATKSAFLASRTAKDAATFASTQHEAERSLLRELHHDLTVQLEREKLLILDLEEAATKAQDHWFEQKLEFQRDADSARSALSQLHVEHGRLTEHYQGRLVQVQRKDAEIVDLRNIIEALSREHSDAAHLASTQHEAELFRLQESSQRQNAELEQQAAQIIDHERTIERITQDYSDLKELGAGTEEALAEKIRELQHAKDETRLVLAEHEVEQTRLRDVCQEHIVALEGTEAQIVGLEREVEQLKRSNDHLEKTAAYAHDAVDRMTLELNPATGLLAKKVKDQMIADQRIAELSATVGALKMDLLRRDKQLADAAQLQDETKAELLGAKDLNANHRSTIKDLKRENAIAINNVNFSRLRKQSMD